MTNTPSKNGHIVMFVIKTSLVRDSGDLELIDRLQLMVFFTYCGPANASFTKATSALLINIRASILSQIENSILWSSRENPSAVYATKDVLVSGAYGGSK
jgi:hypothetical protein